MVRAREMKKEGVLRTFNFSQNTLQKIRERKEFTKKFASLFHGFCEFSTSLELDDFLCGDFNFLLSGGIDALTCGTFGDSESTETEESDFVISLESVANGVESGIKSLLGISFAQTCCSNSIYEISFVHCINKINKVMSIVSFRISFF